MRVTIAGYFLGNVPVIKNNIDLVLILIVLISLVPMGVEYVLHRRRRKQESAAATLTCRKCSDCQFWSV